MEPAGGSEELLLPPGEGLSESGRSSPTLSSEPGEDPSGVSLGSLVDEDAGVDEAPDAQLGRVNRDKVYCLRPSPFPGLLPPTVAFAPTEEGLQALAAGWRGARLAQSPKVFLKYTGVNANVVKSAFKVAGFRKCQGGHFNAIWSSSLRGKELSGMAPYQRVNHFPGTWELGRKDRLWRNLYRMRRRHGSQYHIMPTSFLLPSDHDELLLDWEHHPENMYILKPKSSSRGRGIRMLKSKGDLPMRKGASRKPKECLVQRYIQDPLLIDGYKFDMRVYVLVTSYDPLKVYLHEEGLVRFATEKYSNSPSKLRDRRAHLTNYSVNAKSAKFVQNTDASLDGEGSKWSLAALAVHLERETGAGTWARVWAQVRDIVAKTLLSVEAKINTCCKMHVSHPHNCYELYGLDVVLDSRLRAWLIEANTGPALHCPSPLDRRIKSRVVCDMLNVVGFAATDKAKFKKEEEARRTARLLGLGGSRKGQRGGTTGLGGSADSKPKRDVRLADSMDFRGVKPRDLPRVVLEYEAEHQLRGGFHAVLPCREAPGRYQDFFEVLRYDNLLLKRWLATGSSAP